MEREEEVMGAPAVSQSGPSCRLRSFQHHSARKSGSHVRHLFRLLLAALLTGQASCNYTSTTSSPLTATTTQEQSSAAYYVVTISVAANEKRNVSEVTAWLTQVFQSDLESCVPPNHPNTTTQPPSTPTSTFQTANATVSTVTSSYYTAAATTQMRSNASGSSTAPAATATTGSNRTTTASTTLEATTAEALTTTAAATSAAATTTAALTTTAASTTTASAKPAASTTPPHSVPTTTLNLGISSQVFRSENRPHPNPNSPGRRVVREAQANDMQTSGTSSRNTTGLFQGMEVVCEETAETSCVIMLKLRESVASCCILQTLCTANTNSSDMQVVGNRADRTSQLQHECHPEEESSCIYDHGANSTCIDSAFVEYHSNSSHCGAGSQKSNCSCSAYCNGTDAYYTFQLSISDVTIDIFRILSQFSQSPQALNCSQFSQETCELVTFLSQSKGVSAACVIASTNLQSCTVVLKLPWELPNRNMSAAVTEVLQPHSGPVHFDRQVARMATCDNYTSNGTLDEAFTWCGVDLAPGTFCTTAQQHNIPSCQNGKNATLPLEGFCTADPFATAGPNVAATTAQPNTTSANITSSPMNTTAESLNVTTIPINTTTINTTTTIINTTIITTINSTTNTTTTTPNNTTTTTPINTINTTTTTPINTTTTTPINTTTTTPINTTTTTPINTTTTTPINTTTTTPINTTTTTTPINTTTTTTAAVSGGAPDSTVAATTGTTARATDGATVTTSDRPTTTASAESRANALLDLARNVSSLNASQISQLVSELERLLSGPNVSLSLGNISVQIVSSLLGATPEVLSQSSNRIIGVVDTVALKLVLGEQAETLLSSSLALSVKPADGANFQETSFSIVDPNTVQVRRDRRLRRSSRRDSSVPQGVIRLPASLTQSLTSEQQQLVSRVQFNFYQSSAVFQDGSLGERRLNSGILGASVANLSIAGLQENVEIVLRNMEPVPANFVASCVFWDFAMNNRSGGWNSDGCFMMNSTANETLCSCNHLTSFAILLDISRQPILSRVQATILTFITYIGCGVSAIFLSITLLTYLSFGKLRKDIPSKILIQLCMALLLLNLVFLVDAWLALYPEAVGLCISTAWFLHYFLLVAFTWMGLEAVHMYLALVKVFNSYISRYMLKFSLVGWGVPMIVVIIVIAIDKDNYGLVSYGRFADGTSDVFCWLKNDVAFYVAVVAYFCIIFVFNLIMFVVVLVQLCRIKRQNPHNSSHRTTLQDVRSVSGITILLGLTWGFAFFAWGPVNTAFMYLFAIFNSLQGFFIFVFHCAAKENVRRQWRTYLCCGRMRLAENSEWSRTATQKTAKKSSVTRLTSLQSSESSNSNNSAAFLFSDASDQSNGLSSPFDDRTIAADEDNRMDVILNEVNSQYRTN
ncbi:uncharacterized protein LOC142892101 [Nelusetta ayraudi]|uniref:uncharacterized protein LOC142892101 n=1 Tax=Nelusetta ayraudi TaxID=303726 RepID=UPI003F6ED65C